MSTEIINIEEIEEAIIAYANGDFSKRLNISDSKDARDGIVAGINMLGEELEQTTISKNYFSSVYNAVSDMLIVTDLNGIITDVNGVTSLKVKLAKEALVGLSTATIGISNYTDIQKAMSGNDESNCFEVSLTNSFEETIPLSCSISKIRNNRNEHEGYLIIAKDITQEKNQEKRLLEVMIETEEKERKRLAYDIHDSLGQELSALQMYLSTISTNGTKDKQFEETLNTCKDILNQSIENTRKLAFDLMPKSLEDGCLECAVKGLIDSLAPLCKISLNYRISHKLKKEEEVIIYRIFQEFINNSIKHASPYNILINTCEIDNRLFFKIEDNGKGFSMENIQKGNGVFNIRTRLKALNAVYRYDSTLNKGTTLEFTIEK